MPIRQLPRSEGPMDRLRSRSGGMTGFGDFFSSVKKIARAISVMASNAIEVGQGHPPGPRRDSSVRSVMQQIERVTIPPRSRSTDRGFSSS